MKIKQLLLTAAAAAILCTSAAVAQGRDRDRDRDGRPDHSYAQRHDRDRDGRPDNSYAERHDRDGVRDEWRGRDARHWRDNRGNWRSDRDRYWRQGYGRFVGRDVYFRNLRANHYTRWDGEPYWFRGRYVIRTYNRHGRAIFVEMNPYTGRVIGVVRF